MSEVEAIFQHGVFKPLAPVALPENQRVRLSVEPVAPAAATVWLEEVRQLHGGILGDRKCFPDSAPELAADRAR